MADRDDKGAGDGSTRKLVVLGVVIVALVLVGVLVSVSLFNKNAENAQGGAASGPEVTDGLDADLTITNVDPIKAEMSIRLALRPIGSYADQDGTLAKPVTLFYDSVDGTKQIEFKPGKPVGATDLSVPLLGDSVSRYPWDQNSGDIEMQFVTVEPVAEEASAAPTTTTTTAPPAASEDGGGSTPTTTAAPKVKAPTRGGPTVPVQMAIYKNVPAYSVVDAVVSQPDSDGVLRGHFDVSRAGTALAFSLLITVIMWGLAIGVLIICLSVILGRRKMEVGLLSMMGAILFALPAALRNSQPGIPPPGVLADFYGFFWCAAIVAVSLISTIVVYIVRKPS